MADNNNHKLGKVYNQGLGVKLKSSKPLSFLLMGASNHPLPSLIHILHQVKKLGSFLIVSKGVLSDD